MPLVSIIVPVYNVENYIEKCLESVKNQSYTKFECLIVNDGSKDKSIDLAQKFTEIDSRFKILNKPNGGLASARNFGIKHSTGEFIAFLDSDDAWEKNKLQNQIEVFSKNKNIDLVYSNVMMHSEETNKNFDYKGERYQGNPLELLYSNKVIGSGSSVIISKKVIEKVGVFNESLKSFEDLEYWFRCAINDIKFHFIPERDVIILKRNISLSTNKSKMMANNIICFKMQLIELRQKNFSIAEVKKNGLIRIRKSRKFFNSSTPLRNLFNLVKLYSILFKNLVALRFNQ